MKKLYFVNNGLIEAEALTLLGASTKHGDDTKIGRFGSGNKYAIAYLIRNGYDIDIISGGNRIEIGLNHKVFREHEFDVLVIGGKETSITTEFGYEWDLWQALRELYSNAVDEGLIYFGISEHYQTTDINSTVISIEITSEIEEFMFNIQNYIAIKKELLYECNYGKIYKKHGSTACVYHKGIRCVETKQPSAYDYDFNNARLGENRLLLYSWHLGENMWNILFQCDNAMILHNILHTIQDPEYIENCISSSLVSMPIMENKSTWYDALAGSKVAPRELSGYLEDDERPYTYIVPNRLYTILVNYLGNGIKCKSFSNGDGDQVYKVVDLNAIQLEVFEKAKLFLQCCNYSDPLSHTIIFCQFVDQDILGSINRNNNILLSSRALDQGVHITVAVLMEEHIHSINKNPDGTRKFQNDIFSEFINYMKKVFKATI